jgi:farnesol dehydrogenase
MERRIFVTGATGFIGMKLVSRLVESGNIVHALVRNPAHNVLASNSSVKLVHGDLMNIRAIYKGMENCSQVYHLAGKVSTWAKDPKDFYETHVAGTQNILEAARKWNIEKIIITSSGAVLGPSTSNPVTENSKRVLPFFNDYEKSKHLMERLAKRYSTGRLQIVLVNPARVYGPGLIRESNTAIEIIRKYLQGNWKLIPGRDHIGSYAYVDDVVDGHILAMEKGRSGERYILGGDNRKFSDLFVITRNLTDVNRKLYKIPLSLVLLTSLIETTFANLFKRKPKLPFDWSSKLTYDWAMSSEKAKQELGYKVMPLEEGLKKTISWLLKNEQEEAHPGLDTSLSSGMDKSPDLKFDELQMKLRPEIVTNGEFQSVEKDQEKKDYVKLNGVGGDIKPNPDYNRKNI